MEGLTDICRLENDNSQTGLPSLLARQSTRAKQAVLTCEAALGSQLTEARQQFGTTVTAEVFLSFHKEVTSKKPKASQMTLSARLANLKVTPLVERELASTETSQYSSADFESKAEKTEQRLERQSKGHVLSQDEIREIHSTSPDDYGCFRPAVQTWKKLRPRTRERKGEDTKKN